MRLGKAYCNSALIFKHTANIFKSVTEFPSMFQLEIFHSCSNERPLFRIDKSSFSRSSHSQKAPDISVLIFRFPFSFVFFLKRQLDRKVPITQLSELTAGIFFFKLTAFY